MFFFEKNVIFIIKNIKKKISVFYAFYLILLNVIIILLYNKHKGIYCTKNTEDFLNPLKAL